MEGAGFTVILTLDTDTRHGLLEMDHPKTFVPKPSPVIVEVGDSEFVIVPLPEIKFQTPLPTVGLFAAIVVVGVF